MRRRLTGQVLLFVCFILLREGLHSLSAQYMQGEEVEEDGEAGARLVAVAMGGRGI